MIIMFQNYFKVAFRNLMRNKVYTTIKVLGLAIGISACLTIFQTVKYERSFDRFHADQDLIYRIYTQFDEVGEDVVEGFSFPMVAIIEEGQVAGVESSAPLQMIYTAKVQLEDKRFRDLETVTFTTPDFFEIFSGYDWLSGSPATALNAPNQVVLTESQAHRYFGLTDVTKAVGETLIYQDSLGVMVSGIVADLEQASDLYFTDFISYSTIENSWYKKELSTTEWSSFYTDSQIFIKKQATSDNKSVTNQLNTIFAQNVEREDGDDPVSFHLQPLSDLHSNAKLTAFLHSPAAIPTSTLQVLIGIAILLLLIASINFINLTTAQSFQRSKEVGVRKVLGSSRSILIKQFLSESSLLTTVAIVFSIFITYWGIHYFKDFLPEGMTLQLLQPSTLLFLLMILIIVSLLSGSYPAFVLSSTAPATALKGQGNAISMDTKGNWVRKSLIIVQFSITMLLITGTLVIGQQIDYLLNKDLGINKEAIVNFYSSWRYPSEKKQLLKEELNRLAEVTQVSIHSTPAASQNYMTSRFQFEVNGTPQSLDLSRKVIDENYLDLYDIELLAGRPLTPSNSTKEFLINEKMLSQMGLQHPSEAIGKTLQWGESSYPIVGVTEDFHHRELQLKIEPLMMSMHERSFAFSLKMDTPNMIESMKKVEQVWQKVYPEESFRYEFLEDSIAKFYETEQRAAKLLQAATGIAIFISCIGLLGLVSFSVARRTREIGIRKVLGANVADIVALLSKDFLLLVFIAVLLASPLAWYFAKGWLEQFAYRIELQWWMFALAGLTAIGIALLTVSFQSIKAALSNPIESLRNE